jgi:hypothetical protein
VVCSWHSTLRSHCRLTMGHKRKEGKEDKRHCPNWLICLFGNTHLLKKEVDSRCWGGFLEATCKRRTESELLSGLMTTGVFNNNNWRPLRGYGYRSIDFGWQALRLLCLQSLCASGGSGCLGFFKVLLSLLQNMSPKSCLAIFRGS